MAHELASEKDMAYVGISPWHSLGSKLPPNQPISVWQKASGMDFEIKQTPVLFNTANGDGNILSLRSNPEATVLYRSDTNEPLSVVSKRYKVVQPREVLEFFRDLVLAGGMELETAGVLRSGKKFWALAKTGQSVLLPGLDKVNGYLLLATSSDSSLATSAFFTSIRVVCNNTLQMAVGESKGAVKVPHSRVFDPVAVKQELGLGLSAWDEFMTSIKALSKRPVNKFEALTYLVNVLGDPDLPIQEQPNQKTIQSVYDLFAGEGKGSKLQSSSGTTWGLLNSVTEHVDHLRRSRSQDSRLDSALFGIGAAIKQRAFEKAVALTA